MDRRVKIVASIGPACQGRQMIGRLIEHGMNVARLNFSHGTQAGHLSNITDLRAAANEAGCPLTILQDLQGPKIRVGMLDKPLQLQPGDLVSLVPEGSDIPGEVIIPVEFPELFEYASRGTKILLDDGRISLTVLEAGKELARAEVASGGILTSHKGINLPGVSIDIPAFTEKDASDLEFGISQDVDAVAISFVRNARDVEQVREAMNGLAKDKLPILIAKIERPEALESLDAILRLVDGVMVARGDLGVEMAPEDVPGAQKHIIQEANRQGKLVITATQMLESMIHNPLPTRAEASDVANAVFDGTDAVMLSAETAVGKYPVEAVTMMDRIVKQAEDEYASWGRPALTEADDGDDAIAMTHAVRELAHDRDVKAIAVFTRGGRSAWAMAKSRPCVPILAFTPEEKTYQQLALAWGVKPHIVPYANTVEMMISYVENSLRETGFMKPGQQAIIVCGYPVGELCPPNMALLHTIR
jgi:pyruvate kinase